MSDKLNDDEEKIEGAEEDTDMETESTEPDFAPTAAAPITDDEDDLEADPHSAFDTPTPEVEDPHMDIYGDAGSPYKEDEEEDEEDTYDGDSDSY